MMSQSSLLATIGTHFPTHPCREQIKLYWKELFHTKVDNLRSMNSDFLIKKKQKKLYPAGRTNTSQVILFIQKFFMMKIFDIRFRK